MARRDRRKRPAALLASLLIHTALLAPLLLVAPRLRISPSSNRATMLLGLVPEAELGLSTHQTPPGPSGTNQAARAPQPPAQHAFHPNPKPSSPSATEPASQPSTTTRASTGPTPGESGTPPAAASAGDQAAARRALRAALACAPSNAQNLDVDGRAVCGKRLSEAAAAMGDAKVDTIPPLKRAYYDAVQKAYQDIRHYPTPDTALTHLPGAEGIYDQRLAAIHGRPPMTGCGLTFGGPKGAKPAGAPPHSLYFKLGPVICGVTPPQGLLTEESATPNADDVP